MTLQYRIRSKYEDDKWRCRLDLCSRLLSEALDQWCRMDGDFPFESVVAAVLYLFSLRCEPFQMSPCRISEQLSAKVGSPESECKLTWPTWGDLRREALIDAIRAVLALAVNSWSLCDSGNPTAEAVTQQIATEIVAHQYVVFHHHETTKRDVNPWGI